MKRRSTYVDKHESNLSIRIPCIFAIVMNMSLDHHSSYADFLVVLIYRFKLCVGILVILTAAITLSDATKLWHNHGVRNFFIMLKLNGKKLFYS